MTYSFILKSQFFTHFVLDVGVWSIFCYILENFSTFFALAYAYTCEFINPLGKKSLREKYGEWAVVTGATAGIGEKYAHQLAGEGVNIVLISRSEPKLIKVARDIQTKHSVRAKCIVADFTKGETVYEEIENKLTGVTVGILVNNVGLMNDPTDSLENIAERDIWNMIYTNIAAATFLTRLVIPSMKKNGKGAIVNVSSGSSITPLPFAAVYSASKAYIENFTLAIKSELKPYKNIAVQVVSPMLLRENTADDATQCKIRYNKYVSVCVDEYARFAVSTLGITTRTTGFWWHGVQIGIVKLFPRWFKEKFMYKVCLHLSEKSKQKK